MDDRDLVTGAVGVLADAKGEDKSVRAVGSDGVGIDLLCDMGDLPPALQVLARDVVQLYTARSKIEVQKLLMSRYSDRAIFSNNLVLVANLDNIRAVFLLRRNLAKRIEARAVSARLRFITRASGNDCVELDVHTIQRFHYRWVFFFPRHLRGTYFTMHITSTLTLDGRGKVIMHRDQLLPLWNVPTFLRLMAGLPMPLLTTFFNF